VTIRRVNQAANTFDARIIVWLTRQMKFVGHMIVAFIIV